jgi:hypothetical protein
LAHVRGDGVWTGGPSFNPFSFLWSLSIDFDVRSGPSHVASKMALIEALRYLIHVSTLGYRV